MFPRLYQVLQSKFETNKTRGLWVMIQSHPIQSNIQRFLLIDTEKREKVECLKGGGAWILSGAPLFCYSCLSAWVRINKKYPKHFLNLLFLIEVAWFLGCIPALSIMHMSRSLSYICLFKRVLGYRWIWLNFHKKCTTKKFMTSLIKIQW